MERPVHMAPGLGVDGFFTEADLAAADQLVQLSVSGGPEAASPTSSSLSARSVNNTEAAGAAGKEDGHDDGGVVDRRARKRYRRMAELYHATRPAKRAGAGAGSGGKRRREERDRRQIDRPASWVLV